MDDGTKRVIWGQFGAAIDMLENALLACPDSLWADRSSPPEFWYMVFHTLFWLDYYLEGTPEGYAPPSGYPMTELDPEGAMPGRVYSKAELQEYLRHGRRKCRAVVGSLTAERAAARCGFPRRDLSIAELLLYNARHVQHHAGQLNLILRQRTDSAPRWVARAGQPLAD